MAEKFMAISLMVEIDTTTYGLAVAIDGIWRLIDHVELCINEIWYLISKIEEAKNEIWKEVPLF